MDCPAPNQGQEKEEGQGEEKEEAQERQKGQEGAGLSAVPGILTGRAFDWQDD